MRPAARDRFRGVDWVTASSIRSFERQVGQGGWGSMRLALVRSIRSSARVTSNLRFPGSKSGMRTVNVLPWPAWLSSWTSPPRSLVSSRTIERPRPGSVILAGQHVVGLSGELCLAEFLEDRFPVFLGDSDSRVLDFDHHEAALGPGPQA